MKKITKLLFIILLLLVLGVSLQAQNLVPNCSFEDTILCPANFGLGHIELCNGWYSAGTDQSSPDYYKDCGEFPSVPYNTGGFQFASTGNSYAGLLPYIKGDTIQNEKEFIGTQLTMPLVIGQQYYVSFKVSFTFSDNSGYASNKIGALFSTIEYNNYNPAPVNNFAHFYTDSIITDTSNWVPIHVWFIADSAYQYINIGNFFDEAHTDTIRVHQAPWIDNISYYYIDDICVSLDSAKCSCVTGNTLNEFNSTFPFSIYYNPGNNKIYVKNSSLLTRIKIKIYDVTGNLLDNLLLQESNIEIDVNHLAKGIYVMNILTNNKSYNQKVFIY